MVPRGQPFIMTPSQEAGPASPIQQSGPLPEEVGLGQGEAWLVETAPSGPPLLAVPLAPAASLQDVPASMF